MDLTSKRLRFSAPTVLTPETRILTALIPGGIAVREWESAWEQWVSAVYISEQSAGGPAD